MMPPSNILSIDELNQLTRKPKSSGESSEAVCEIWPRLIKTVQSPVVSDRHMTATCNAICFIVRSNANSKNTHLENHAYSTVTWEQTFAAARSAFVSGKNKPALQVLDTLHFLAKNNPDRAGTTHVVEHAVTEVARIVFSQHPKRHLKMACIMLYFFLRKLSDFMSLSGVLEQAFEHERAAFSQLCRASGMTINLLGDECEPQWLAFVLALLFAARFAESKSATLKLLALLCELPTSVCKVDISSIMSRSIDTYSAADETALDAITRDVLPSILVDRGLYFAFLSEQSRLIGTNTAAILVILGLLQFGKTKGFVEESDLPTMVRQYCYHIDSEKELATIFEPFSWLLSHHLASVRLRACDVLISSTSPIKPLPTGVLSCLTDNLGYLHDDTDAFYRGELFSIFRRFLTRVQQSKRVLEINNGDCAILQEYETFYSDYLAFVRRELASGNSYGRHTLALQLLDLMTDTSRFSGSLQDMIFSDQDLLMDLFRLVIDPYEDVRALASELLSRAATRRRNSFVTAVEGLAPLSSVAALAGATNRADHADAFGRILSLVPDQASHEAHNADFESMENMVNRLTNQLVSYVSTISEFNVTDGLPLHGTMLGIKFSVDKCTDNSIELPDSTMETQSKLCQKIWSLAYPHLCVDSPEIESESSENSDLGPKDLLAFAWRALRDSNLLMQAILENAGSNTGLVAQMGDLAFDQLKYLRHRGAFSTVAQTFMLCCQKARDSADPAAQNLVHGWFLCALDELETQADRLTRRSAGLPAMFAAVLNPVDAQQFGSSFQLLVEKAQEPTPPIRHGTVQDKLRLPQVHALNCIKEIITASRFRTLTEPLVIFTLNLAARSMSSNIWAMKNCGLMLLRASINRLDPDTGLGNAEAGIKLRSLSDSDRRPVDLAVEFLGQAKFTQAGSADSPSRAAKGDENSSESSEAQFAGLDILGRLYISKGERDILSNLVAHKLGHPLWHIRAQASRLLVSMVPQGSELSTLRDVLPKYEVSSRTSLNFLHGILMLVDNLFQRVKSTMDTSLYEDDVIKIIAQLSTVRAITSCSSLMAKWLSLANQVLEMQEIDENRKQILHEAFRQVSLPSTKLSHHVDALYRREQAIFNLYRHTLLQVIDGPTVTEYLQQSDDTAEYALGRFRLASDTRSLQLYSEVLICLVDARTTEHCRAAVLRAITDNVISPDAQIEHSKFNHLLGLADFKKIPSRKLLEQQLVYFAALCRWAWMHDDKQALNRLKNSVGGFCLHMRTACDDEVEIDTRFSVVTALRQWGTIPDLPNMLDRLFEPIYKLDMISVLYDLLNDDDENIREEASRFTGSFVSKVGIVLHSSPILFCAAASRRKLLDYVAREFEGTQMLSYECLRRILGVKLARSRHQLEVEIATHLSSFNVNRRVIDILGSTNDLFAEERQNLYVDDTNEIISWSALFQQSSATISANLANKLAVWAKDGIKVFTSLFEGNHPLSLSLLEIEHKESVIRPCLKVMFGTCLTQDLETLLTQVVLGLKMSDESERSILEMLLRQCVRLNMSQTVITAFP